MKSIALSLFFASLARVALGQGDPTPSSAAAPTLVETGSSSTVATHVVTVGKALNAFVPDSIIAAKGDIIQFQFFPPNHSVGRADYGQPCIPFEDTGEGKVGFWSGFYPVSKILPNPPTWNLTLNDTEPIFLYCAAPGSCINYQMIGVINPNSSVSLATQKREAANSQYMLAPGQAFPSEGGVPSGDVNPTTNTAAKSSPSTSSMPLMPSMPSMSMSGYSHKLSNGAIAGIAVAAVVVLALVAALLFLLGRHKILLQFLHRTQDQFSRPQNPHGDQNMRTPPPQMVGVPHPPGSPPEIPYSEIPNYHDHNYTSPSYSEHPSHGMPPSVTMAELPSPGEKKSQEYIAPVATKQYRDVPNPAPTPQPQSRPLSFWGRSKSTKAQISELSADLEPKGPTVTTSRYQPKR